MREKSMNLRSLRRNRRSNFGALSVPHADRRWIIFSRMLVLCLFFMLPRQLPASVSDEKLSSMKTKIRRAGDRSFALYRNEEMFTIRGAGGHRYLDRFQTAGGNTLRTWGVEQLEREIDG